MSKFERIKAYLLNMGNYDFPFNKYLESVKRKTGVLPHPYVHYYEFFYDDPEDANGNHIGLRQFALIVRHSPRFNPNHQFFWYEGDELRSADRIYPDIYDVDKVATWCVENNDDLDYDDDIHNILFEEEDE